MLLQEGTFLLLPHFMAIYRDGLICVQILFSRTQAGPGRTVKQEQDEISPNHIQKLNFISVEGYIDFNWNSSQTKLDTSTEKDLVLYNIHMNLLGTLIAEGWAKRCIQGYRFTSPGCLNLGP